MKIIQLPEGLKIPDEILTHITDKAKQAPQEVRMEYTQLMIANWVKMNYEDNFVKTISKPQNISLKLNEFLEEKPQ